MYQNNLQKIAKKIIRQFIKKIIRSYKKVVKKLKKNLQQKITKFCTIRIVITRKITISARRFHKNVWKNNTR